MTTASLRDLYRLFRKDEREPAQSALCRAKRRLKRLSQANQVEDDRNGHPTMQLTVGQLHVVARLEPDNDWSDLSHLGEFCNRPSGMKPGRTLDPKQQAANLTKAIDHWALQLGCDPDREGRSIRNVPRWFIPEVGPDENRKAFSRMGYSKQEAWVKSRAAWLSCYTEMLKFEADCGGTQQMCTMVVRASIGDVELAMTTLGGIEYDYCARGEAEQRQLDYLYETTEECISEVVAQAKQELKRLAEADDAESQHSVSTILSKGENRVVSLLAKAWDAFLALPRLHDDEIPDFRKAIHDAQRLIMARPVQAEFNQEVEADVG